MKSDLQAEREELMGWFLAGAWLGLPLDMSAALYKAHKARKNKEASE